MPLTFLTLILLSAVPICSSEAITTHQRTQNVDTVLVAKNHPSRQTKPWISPMRDMYVITGVPLDREITNETLDVKIMLSIKLFPFGISDRWTCYFGYSQMTVWNAFGKSFPFHDNTYMPGFYFDGDLKYNNRLILGLEHRSNGRPYYGNPLVSETVEDYSRGMNYIFASWRKTIGRHKLGVDAKAGFSTGIGQYPRCWQRYTQDLYLHYLGYATLDYSFDAERFSFHTCVTPIGNKSIANVTIEPAFRIVKSDKFPLRLMMQFHYGYDEALCDCVQGAKPPVNVRIGFLIK